MYTKIRYKFLYYLLNLEARIAQSVHRRAIDWVAGVQFPVASDYSLLLSVQTRLGVHPAIYAMGTGCLSPGVKRLRC
jgi:hypothetical protein